MASHPVDPGNTPGKDTEEIVKALSAEIATHAKAKRFREAEALREKLMEVAPSALTEIINAAGVIEEEKTAGLDGDHLSTWESLYKELNEEETNCLFYSLKKVVVPPQKRILTHGGYNTRLYFIEKGSVAVVDQRGNGNKVLAQLGRGDMLGEYTFTTISVCSASVLSTTEVHLRYLESVDTDGWHLDHPALYEKLTLFCDMYGQVKAIEARQKKEEDSIPSYKLDGVATAYPLSKEGVRAKSYFRGGLTDISCFGCCFDIKSSKKESVRTLLAKKLELHLLFTRSESGPSMQVVGKVEKVNFLLHNDYTVYVTFDTPIGEMELQEKVKRAK